VVVSDIILSLGPFDGMTMKAPEGSADLLLDMLEEDHVESWVYTPSGRELEGWQIWKGKKISDGN
jgi:hypothetical protein